MIAALISVAVLAQVAATPAMPANAEAETLFKQGLQAYDAREFARAIELFEAAHALEPLPEILFDIGMAHKALGDCQHAAASFDRFISAVPPADPLLPRARARRAELGACRSEASNESSPRAPNPTPALVLTSPPPPPASAAVTITAAPPAASGPRLREACVASVAGAALLGAGGMVFGLKARSAEQEVENIKEWDDAAARADERGRTYGQAATWLLVSAGVTSMVAITTCLLRR
jgi:tetratricopeptide (TPR) repeat protein